MIVLECVHLSTRTIMGQDYKALVVRNIKWNYSQLGKKKQEFITNIKKFYVSLQLNLVHWRKPLKQLSKYIQNVFKRMRYNIIWQTILLLVIYKRARCLSYAEMLLSH